MYISFPNALINPLTPTHSLRITHSFTHSLHSFSLSQSQMNRVDSACAVVLHTPPPAKPPDESGPQPISKMSKHTRQHSQTQSTSSPETQTQLYLQSAMLKPLVGQDDLSLYVVGDDSPLAGRANSSLVVSKPLTQAFKINKSPTQFCVM